MKNENGWKDNSVGDLPQYDFAPPSHWSKERIAAEQATMLEALQGVDGGNAGPASDWLSLATHLPSELRQVLIEELRVGNQLTGIGCSDWPNDGSIVVNMANLFQPENYEISPNVHWRNMNDPHYCREEISQKVNGIEYLIIT